jgi:hypothetical protein
LLSGTGEEVLKDLWQKWCEHLSGKGNGDLPQLFNTIEGACGTKYGDEQKCNAQAVIYDRHGSWDQEVHKGNGLNEGVLFWEPYGKQETQAALLESPPDNPVLKATLEYQFLEAGLVWVAVLDERVQDGVEPLTVTVGKEGKPPRQAPLQEVLSHMRVLVPEKQCKACKEKGSQEEGKEKQCKACCDLDHPDLQQIENWVKTQCTGFDFLVIHQGILDRLQEQGQEQGVDPCKRIEQLVREAEIVHLVVCSGRGMPSGRPASSRFVPLSSVLKWTVQTKSKYHLCQLLFASRRPQDV